MLFFFPSGLHPEGSDFYLNGRPFRILSGSFHYFRTQPAQWGDRLERMKAAGLNTLTTYVPWNLHEKVTLIFIKFIHFAGFLQRNVRRDMGFDALVIVLMESVWLRSGSIRTGIH